MPRVESGLEQLVAQPTKWAEQSRLGLLSNPASVDPHWRHARMLINQHFPVADQRVSISGHSMGGHGALTIALKNPDRYRSVSAFAPIVAPTQVPWGRKAFAGYLGTNEHDWQQYDATELVKQVQLETEILIDQGDADNFLVEQLKPELFAAACAESGQALQLRMQPGYDHSYFFIATFIEDHLRFHATALFSP